MTSPGKPGPSLTFEQQDVIEELRAVLRNELPIEEGGYRLSAATTSPQNLEAWGNQPGPVLFFQEATHVLLRLEHSTAGEEVPAEEVTVAVAEQPEELTEAPTRLRALLVCARDAMRGRDALVASEGYAPSVLGAMTVAVWRAAKKLGGKQKPVEAWVEAMRKTREVAPFVVLAVEPETLASAVASLTRWLEENHPLVQLPLVELLVVPGSSGWGKPATEPSLVQTAREGLRMTMQLFLFEMNEGERVVRDIKEQEIFMVPHDSLGELPRYLACLTAWAKMLPARLASIDSDDLLAMMPHDLVDLSPLKLKRPQSEQEFCEVYARRWKVELPEV